MKANELRIGNLVNGVLTQKPYIIDAWALREMESGNYQNSQDTETKVFEPIPLTEEWLLKFGFQKYKTGHNTYKIQSFIIEEGLLKDSPYCFRKRINNENSIELACIKYIHQLQNLYFALTGEELTFKSE